MWTWLTNTFLNSNKYKTHPEAVIISCFFNPQQSDYRVKAFEKFYSSIKHLNYRIVECVIGKSRPQLSKFCDPNISTVKTDSLLWHKETLLNKLVTKLPKQFKYVFWVDADVIFKNLNWLTTSVEKLKHDCKILQPFEYCFHLDKDMDYFPSEELYKMKVWDKDYNHKTNRKVWRSFCANHTTNSMNEIEKNTYDLHGHVGFAWGARREVLETVPLFDKALVGGADHIIAHAATGEIPHPCIKNAFRDNIDEIHQWSEKFHNVVNSNVGFVEGHLYHIWHGDIEKRKYLDRIKEFNLLTKGVGQKDKNGLYVANKQSQEYLTKYFLEREVMHDTSNFLESMAWLWHNHQHHAINGMLDNEERIEPQELVEPQEPIEPQEKTEPVIDGFDKNVDIDHNTHTIVDGVCYENAQSTYDSTSNFS